MDLGREDGFPCGALKPISRCMLWGNEDRAVLTLETCVSSSGRVDAVQSSRFLDVANKRLGDGFPGVRRHVHLHVISSDMISPKLKNKKCAAASRVQRGNLKCTELTLDDARRHWNSFHPTLGYFLHIGDVINDVEGGSLELVRFLPKPDRSSLANSPGSETGLD